MSRIGSSSASGVRVAAAPLSNVYTVLLLVAAVALVVAVVFAAASLQTRYGAVLPVGSSGEKIEGDLQAARTNLSKMSVTLEEGRQQLDQFLSGATGVGESETPAEPETEPAPDTH